MTVIQLKGGVAKTTSAFNIAAFFQRLGPTLLVDGDPNRSASGWAERGAAAGKPLPFLVKPEKQAARYVKDAQFIVIDTQARPTREDLRDLAGECDLMILPTTPDVLSLEALVATVRELEELGVSRDRYRVLLTIVPPAPNRSGEDARRDLTDAGIPVLAASIPRLSAFQKAALEGQAVADVDDRRAGRAWSHYDEAGREIAALLGIDVGAVAAAPEGRDS